MKARTIYRGGFRWDEVPVLDYKSEGSHFREATRQVLFDAAEGLPCALRYFEIAPEGYSTLERHEHPHAVVILRGEGRVLVGEEIQEALPFDLIRVPSQTWHQFRAAGEQPLGFLCLVASERDRPVRPDAAALEALRANPTIAEFIRV